MTTSYSNIGGSGNRTGLITVSTDIGVSGDINVLIKETGSLYFYPGNISTTNKYIKFDFSESFVIDEAKWYQDVGTSNGSWKWQGSNDASNWTDIGSSFTLGGTTVQTQTELSGNTTAYRYYRLLGVSGTVSSAPYLQKIQFKISPSSLNDTYYNTYGVGDRTSIITTSIATGVFASGSLSDLINGSYPDSAYFANTSVTDKWLKFDFNSNTDNSICITEAKFFQQNTTSHGSWKWQGSSDDSNWSDIGSSFTLGGSTEQIQTQLNVNTESYRYYRLLGVSGNLSSNPYIYEFLFKVLTISDTGLTINDSTHSISSDNLAISQNTLLSINDTYHKVYNPDQLLQTESGEFVTDESGNYVEVNDGPVLVEGPPVTNLVVADSTHSVSSDNISTIQNHSIQINDSNHSITSDNVVFAYNYQLEVSDSTHSVLSDNALLSQSHSLSSSDSNHSVISDNVFIGVASLLSVNDSTHSHTSDNINLNVFLSSEDSAHSVTSDSDNLSQSHILSVSKSNHGVSSDNVNLALNFLLVVGDSNHSGSSDNVSLHQANNLVAEDSSHSHIADNTIIYQVHIVSSDDSTHETSSDSLSLTQLHNLSVGDSLHNHTVDDTFAYPWTSINAADSTIVVTSDEVSLFQHHTLSIQTSDSFVESDNVTLFQIHLLTNVPDCLHDHSVDSILSMLEAEIAFKPFFSQANHFIW